MPTQRSSQQKSSLGSAYREISGLADGDWKLLCVLADQQAVPVDQLPRLLGETPAVVGRRAKRLAKGDWLTSSLFNIDKHPWLRLSARAARGLGLSFSGRVLKTSGLNHRRVTNQARIDLSEEFLGGLWVPEGRILRDRGRGGYLPDGAFEYRGERWAIEAELCRKGTAWVVAHVEGLFRGGYDRVIYFAADHVSSCIRDVQASYPAGRVEVRKAKTAEWFMPSEASGSCKTKLISLSELELLRLVAEEGTTSVDQLAILAERDLKSLKVDLRSLACRGLLGQGFGSPGWVWCSARGMVFSGTELGRMAVTSPARLPRRRALMAVRLALTAECPEGYWWTRRMLAHGRPRGIAPEMAVFDLYDIEVAVMALPEAPGNPRSVVRTIEGLAAEYDAVWLYCSPESRPWASRRVSGEAFQTVVVRDLPSV